MAEEILYPIRETGQGKGDKNRISDRANFGKNYDRIDWGHPPYRFRQLRSPEHYLIVNGKFVKVDPTAK